MRIHCFGTTGYHPSPTRHTACYFLPEQALLLDAGSGLFRLIPHLRAAPIRSLDILLSHAHLDHIVGLTFLLDVMATTELQNVRLHGAPDKLAAIREHLFGELIFPVAPPFEFVPLPGEEGSCVIGTTQVRWFPLSHPGGALGYVLQTAPPRSRRVAYITDTTASDESDYVQHLGQLDLLMHECYFSDDQQELALKTGHSWLGQVQRLVCQLRPRRTLLIHVNPLADLLPDEFGLPSTQSTPELQFAEDGQSLEL